VLPDGVPAEVFVRMAAGQMSSELGKGITVSGLGVSQVFRSPEVEDGDEPQLVVRVQSVAGDVHVGVR